MKVARSPLITLSLAVLAYISLIGPFTNYMKSKPLEEKLGYLPSANFLQYVSADQKIFVGAALIMKVVMYFGGLMERPEKVATAPPDYRGMSNILHTALKLDPYNMDGYYFAQSFLTWEVKQYIIANKLLEFGMKYRTWDWYLPFFAGFNYAYFLKDYQKAAEYYKRAGELSGSELYMSLAGRYMQESGQTDLAIQYLKTMIAMSRNEAVKNTFQIRLNAFEEVKNIEQARDNFMVHKGRLPLSIDELLSSGFLSSIPSDPYGGHLYLEPDGKVATTSKFAFGGKR